MNGTDGPVRETGSTGAHSDRAQPVPPVGAWDRIAASSDFDALAEIEGLTNPRIREALGVLATVPRDRWVSGPGTTPVMAAFTHLNPEGSRFSDGTYGVFYAAKEVETAIRETVYHRERFLARTQEPPQRIQMRCYVRRSRDRSTNTRRTSRAARSGQLRGEPAVCT